MGKEREIKSEHINRTNRITKADKTNETTNKSKKEDTVKIRKKAKQNTPNNQNSLSNKPKESTKP